MSKQAFRLRKRPQTRRNARAAIDGAERRHEVNGLRYVGAVVAVRDEWAL